MCYRLVAACRKPDEVVPQDKRRAITLFVGLIIAILACEFSFGCDVAALGMSALECVKPARLPPNLPKVVTRNDI